MLCISTIGFKSTIIQLQNKVSELEATIVGLTSNNSMNTDASPRPGLLADKDKVSEPASDNSCISATVTSIINEEMEKDKRKLNIILYSLPESDKSDPTLRKSHNILEPKSIISKYLETPVTISQAIRIGKKETRLGS